MLSCRRANGGLRGRLRGRRGARPRDLLLEGIDDEVRLLVVQALEVVELGRRDGTQREAVAGAVVVPPSSSRTWLCSSDIACASRI